VPTSMITVPKKAQRSVSTMTRYIPHLVGGKSLEPTGGRVADVFDPSTGEVQARVPLATVLKLNNKEPSLKLKI